MRARAASRRRLYPAEVRMVTSEAEMRGKPQGLRRAGGRVVPRHPRRSRGGDAAQGRAEIRHRPPQHRHRRLRGERHQAAHAAPARQHLLRRACLRADADAGAQARRTRRPRHRRAHQGRARRRSARSSEATRQAATSPASAAPARSMVRPSASLAWARSGTRLRVRARAFDMNVLYHQRTRAPEAQERELKARHVPLSTLLAESDWIVPQLPTAAVDAGPARPRRTCADQARRLHRQRGERARSSTATP